MRTAVHITWHGAQLNFGDLTPYLTYAPNLLEEERKAKTSRPAERARSYPDKAISIADEVVG